MLTREQEQSISQLDNIVDWFKKNRKEPPPQLTVTKKQYQALLAKQNRHPGQKRKTCTVSSYRNIPVKLQMAGIAR